MRRGCISIGGVHCDECGRTIKYPERYLFAREEEDNEVKALRYCIDCCLAKGYAHYKKVEKGEGILTFFIEESFK